MILKIQTQRQGKSLAKLAEGLKQLIRCAYPDVTADMIEILAKHQCTDDFQDKDIRLKVCQNTLSSQLQAFETALVKTAVL